VRTLKGVLEYEGTGYSGFQVQKDRKTIQGEIERALERLTGCRTRIVGAGRTDAGVHATGQVISFECESPVPTQSFADALNCHLPRDIRCAGFEEAPEGFNARRDAKARSYRYLVVESRRPEVLLRNLAYRVPEPLDLDAMRGAAEPLHGTHDFASFGTRVSPRGTTIRTLQSLSVQRRGKFVTVGARADAFLKGMVRAIAGVLIDVGRRRIEETDVARALEARDRNSVAFNAPACGLYLVKVVY
jgi:tRNA pseudouridine38-40 synthase